MGVGGGGRGEVAEDGDLSRAVVIVAGALLFER